MEIWESEYALLFSLSFRHYSFQVGIQVLFAHELLSTVRFAGEASCVFLLGVTPQLALFCEGSFGAVRTHQLLLFVGPLQVLPKLVSVGKRHQTAELSSISTQEKVSFFYVL